MKLRRPVRAAGAGLLLSLVLSVGSTLPMHVLLPSGSSLDGVVAIGPAAALAQSVPTLTTQVTDQAGVLTSGRSNLDSALSSLQKNHGVQLWVLTVSTTSGTTAQTYAQETFAQNGLGGNDLLLVVAVNDHRYGWWQNGAVTSIGDSAVSSLLSSSLESRFQAGDYSGGIADFANNLGSALGGGLTPITPAPTLKPGGSSSSGLGDAIGLIAVAVFLVGGGIILLVWAGRRKGSQPGQTWGQPGQGGPGAPGMPPVDPEKLAAQLSKQANQRLVEMDDAIRDATDDAGFVEAQFGAADTVPFRAAISQAQAEMKAAFTIRQQLDDSIPEDAPTQVRMLQEILGRCDRAQKLIADQHARIESLRDLERRAPEVLRDMPSQAAALESRLPSVGATLQRLAGYGDAGTQPVAGNVEEAQKRITFAKEAAQQGQAALAATPVDTQTAVAAARSGQDALAQAGSLLDAVERLARDLDDARSRLGREMDEARADLQAAQQAIGARAQQGLDVSAAATQLAQAESLLESGRIAASAATPDVLAAVKNVEQSHQVADGLLASFREADQQRAREAAACQTAIRTAEASIRRTSDFIASRRQGVGREARTRIAEAERHLDQARNLADSQPAQGTTEAQTASRMADEAYDLARNDFNDWDNTGGGRRQDTDVTGAIIRGIVLGQVLGGIGRGGGWGGGHWGGGGHGGFGGGGFGGGGGGFGGGGGWGSGGGGGGGGGSGGGGGW